jgi:AraC family transcriptional regulator
MTNVENRFKGAPGARWYFWDGGFLAVGRSRGVIPTHSHHAFQMVVSIDGPGKLAHNDGPWQEYMAAVVRADEPHAYDGNGRFGAMLLIDPESREGRWLAQSIKQPIQAMLQSRIDETHQAIQKFWEEPPDADGTAQLADFIVRQFCTGIMPQRVLDERVVKAIERIQEMDSRVVSLDEVASKVFLSPSRFAHLFTDEVGIPFRRYLLWRRLTRAILLVSRGATLSHAAHAAGFSDSAHFTRTFYQMFGIPPSAMLNQGEVHEIPAPFQVRARG